MPQGNQQLVSYAITAVVVLLVLALRMRRMGQSRPLRLERLWVVPVIYLALVAVLMAEQPPQGTDWLWCLVALIVGGAIGWYRGKTIAITVDPATHALNQKASVAGMIFIAALILVRVGLRSALAGEAQAWHVSATLLVDVFMLLALGLIAAQRLEMFVRASRVLAVARAERAASATASPAPPPSPPPAGP